MCGGEPLLLLAVPERGGRVGRCSDQIKGREPFLVQNVSICSFGGEQHYNGNLLVECSVVEGSPSPLGILVVQQTQESSLLQQKGHAFELIVADSNVQQRLALRICGLGIKWLLLVLQQAA